MVERLGLKQVDDLVELKVEKLVVWKAPSKDGLMVVMLVVVMDTKSGMKSAVKRVFEMVD
jgi:hypothetical protein